MDATKYRCAPTNRARTGTWLSSVAAIRTGQFVKWAPWKVASPICTVIRSGDEIVTSGQRKSFHTARNVNTVRVATGAPISGMRTRTRIRSRPAPSSNAASSRWRGIEMKNCRIR